MLNLILHCMISVSDINENQEGKKTKKIDDRTTCYLYNLRFTMGQYKPCCRVAQTLLAVLLLVL